MEIPFLKYLEHKNKTMEQPISTIQIKFKKITWLEGLDWATGQIDGRNVVEIRCNDDFKHMQFVDRLIDLRIHVDENAFKKNPEIHLAELKEIAVRTIQDFIYKNYFDFLSA